MHSRHAGRQADKSSLGCYRNVCKFNTLRPILHVGGAMGCTSRPSCQASKASPCDQESNSMFQAPLTTCSGSAKVLNVSSTRRITSMRWCKIVRSSRIWSSQHHANLIRLVKNLDQVKAYSQNSLSVRKDSQSPLECQSLTCEEF